MLKTPREYARRFVLGVVMAACLLVATAFQSVLASDFSCSAIYTNGYFTGNIFCTSSTSSAGFYYYYYNVYTGQYTIGP